MTGDRTHPSAESVYTAYTETVNTLIAARDVKGLGLYCVLPMTIRTARGERVMVTRDEIDASTRCFLDQLDAVEPAVIRHTVISAQYLGLGRLRGVHDFEAFDATGKVVLMFHTLVILEFTGVRWAATHADLALENEEWPLATPPRAARELPF